MKRIFHIALSLLVAMSLSGCGEGSHEHEQEHEHTHEHEDHDHDSEEGHEHEHEHDHAHGASDEIILSPEMAKRMGVETAKVAPGEFYEIIEVSGQVLPAPGDVALAVAPTAGVVTLGGSVKPGSAVGAGSHIASVSAKGISGGDVNQAGKVAIDAAKRELERARPLHEKGLITTAEYNAILSQYEAAVAAYSPKAASGSVTTPIGGVITKVLVSQGEYVDAGQPIAEVSRTQRLTLRADLPERYASMLPQITGANFRPAGVDSYIALADIGGQLSSGASMASASGGYLPIYFTFNNNGTTPAGTFADVALIAAHKAGVITVPVTALTEQQGEKYVYVKLDEEGYERRRVDIGGTDGINVEIRSGLNQGDEVVTRGATVIRLAENSGKIPEGHSHNH